MLLHPTTGNLITIESDHNTHPALIQGGLRQRLVEAQESNAGDGQAEAVKQEKKEGDMDTVEEPASKEAKMRKLEELQQQQAQREEYSRQFGEDKPGTHLIILTNRASSHLIHLVRRGQVGQLHPFVGCEHKGDYRHGRAG